MKTEKVKQYVSPQAETIKIESQCVLCSSAMGGQTTESFNRDYFNIP